MSQLEEMPSIMVAADRRVLVLSRLEAQLESGKQTGKLDIKNTRGT